MFIKGHTPWNKNNGGYSLKHDGQFKKGVPSVRKGAKNSEEHRAKLSSALKGKKQTKEAIEKRRQAILASYRNGRVHPRLGVKESPETIEKKRRAALKSRDLLRKAGIKGYMAQDRTKKPTSIERIVYQKLLDLGIVFEKQYVVGNKFIVDVYIPDYNLIIEVDGSYWHSLDRIIKKDKAENAYLKKCGYRLVRIPEQEVANYSMSSLIEKFMAGKDGD